MTQITLADHLANQPGHTLHTYLSAIARQAADRPSLVKIAGNLAWLFFDKAFRMGGGLLINLWLARYLGPEQFGLLNYAIAFVVLFDPVATLGLNGIVVRDLVKKPHATTTTLGTAFVLQAIGSVVAVGLILASIFMLHPESETTVAVVAVLSVTLLFQSSSVIKYWFEAQVQSRYTVAVENSVFLVAAIIRIYLILSEAPLIAFAWTVLAEAVLNAFGLFAVYAKKTGELRRWQASAARTRVLLADSWPLALSGVTILVYMKIDQVMVAQIAGNEEAGIYSAAVRISELWYFIPTIILASTFPYIAKLRSEDSAAENDRWQQLYSLMLWIAVPVSILMTFSSHFLVTLLYGEAYSAASSVLTIHVWAGINMGIGSVWSKWMLLENKLKPALLAYSMGAGLNVLFNFLLIERYGAIGAAVATLLGSWLSALFGFSLYKPAVTFRFIGKALTGSKLLS